MEPRLVPLRLMPGDDLRFALERACERNAITAGFVVAGIGSLMDAKLRFAGQAEATLAPGPSEILTLSGSVAANGAHLHMSVSTHAGHVLGGHVVAGNRVRTTVEVLLASLPDWELRREPDAVTGYAELAIRRVGGGE